MADYDLKSITADTDGPSADTELLFGSPDQSAGTPKPYSFAGIKIWIKAWIAKADVGLGNVTNNLQLTAANNLSDLASLETTRTNIQAGFGSPSNRFYAFNDFVLGSSPGNDFVGSWTGTGAAISTVAVGSFNAIGLISFDLGTTTSGKVSVSSSQISVIKLGAGRARTQAKFAIHTLSNGTDTYTASLGFLDAFTGTPTDGCYFRYTDGVNSGKWQAVTRSNNVETATDTGITPVADTLQLFRVDVNAAGTSVAFYIDNVLVATNTTNIPTGGGRELGYGCGAIKSAGTTATSGGYIDFMEIDFVFTTPR